MKWKTNEFVYNLIFTYFFFFGQTKKKFSLFLLVANGTVVTMNQMICARWRWIVNTFFSFVLSFVVLFNVLLFLRYFFMIFLFLYLWLSWFYYYYFIMFFSSFLMSFFIFLSFQFYSLSLQGQGHTHTKKHTNATAQRLLRKLVSQMDKEIGEANKKEKK